MDAGAGEFVEQVREWKANHFTMADLDNDVPRLLRQVANSMELLGTIDVHDVTFSAQVAEGGSEECQMTVYFDFRDSE